MTTLKLHYTEIFYSLQGEGRFVGAPSVFLRTFGCNFRCKNFGRYEKDILSKEDTHNPEVIAIIKNIDQYKKFEDLPLVNTGCDTYSSIYPEFKRFTKKATPEELVDRMLSLVPGENWQQVNSNDVHLVITGGEPLLGWQRAYEELLSYPRMQSLRNLTFETNGTQQLQENFKSYLVENWRDHPLRGWNNLTFSVSPKLSASGESWEKAIRPEVIQEYQQYGFTYLKFVIETEQHFAEVDRAVYEYRNCGFVGPVYVMPQGGVAVPYERNRINVANWALEKGYYYSPRLHIDIWGNAWGR